MKAFRILVLIKVVLGVTECRVFCQDAHASPWIPLGYSCPVMCQNIISAIERLKVMDYRSLLEGDRRKKQKVDGDYINRVINSSSSESREPGKGSRDAAKDKKRFRFKNKYGEKHLRGQPYIQKLNKAQDIPKWESNNFLMNNKPHYKNINDNDIKGFGAKKQDGGPSLNHITKYKKEHGGFGPATPYYESAFRSNTTGRYQTDYDIKKSNEVAPFIKMAGKMDQLEAALKSALGNRFCDWSKGRSYVLIKKIWRKCVVGDRRNGYGADFLRTLTKTMNRFSEASFEFTEDMVEGDNPFQLMLQRVFGRWDGSSGDLFDLGKLLHFLRNAMESHKLHRRKQATIVLKPRHCLSLSVPGCFCRPGFVEKSGQCVQPADCFPDRSNQMYLARIIVH